MKLTHPIAFQAFHIPADTRNPYQSLLTRALREQGVAASVARTRDVRGLLQREYQLRKLLHVHWLPRGQWGPRNLLEFYRFGRLVRDAHNHGTVVVWTVHNLFSHESRNRWRERRLARYVIANSDGLIVHSPSAIDMVRSEFGIGSSKRISAIPHGNYIGTYASDITVTQARAKLGLTPDNRVFVFLGTIRPYKGVPELLRAFRLISRPDARLVIAGHPQDERTREILSQAAAADDRVLLHLSFIPDDDVQIYLRAADTVVLPYLNVLTSGAAVLAMSFARACVAPRSGCLPDYFAQQPELLYNPTEPNALVRTLEYALANLRLVEDAGAQNFSIAQQWNWNSVARQTSDFYFQCADANAAASHNF